MTGTRFLIVLVLAMAAWCASLGGRLVELDISPGEKVALVVSVLMLGGLMAGAVLVALWSVMS